jgi:hypothetical protein
MAFDPTGAVEYRAELPKDIIRFGGRSGSEERFRMLNPQVQEQLITAAQEYYNQTGRKLQVNSAFRTVDDQKRLYDESVAAGRPGRGPTGMPIAKPGTSKHSKGIVVDIQQGKDDPIAQQILSQRGFSQNVPGDPVHFEFIEKKPTTTAAPTMQFDPTGATEFTEPTPQPERPGALRTAQAGLAGITQGALAGLGQYPAAGLVSLASRVAPQGGQPLSYRDALSQVRESQQSLQQEAPFAYGAGEVGGGLAGFAKLAGLSRGATNVIPKATKKYQPIPLVASPSRVAARETGEKIGGAIRGSMEPGALVRGAGVAAGMGATQEYTSSPEATLGEAATTGAITGGVTAALGGAGKLVEAGVSKVGEKAISKTVDRLIDADTPEARQGLLKTFGPAYKAAYNKALSQQPTMEQIKAELGKRASASSVLQEYNKRLSAWKKENAGLKDITTFSQRYVDDPSLIQKYTSGAAAESTTGFAEGVRGAASRIQSLQSQQFGQQLAGQALTLGGLGGLGAGGGALFGYLTGQDPLSYAIGGGGGLATAAAAAKFGGTRQFLNPTTIGSVGGMATGTQGYRIGDLFNPRPE